MKRHSALPSLLAACLLSNFASATPGAVKAPDTFDLKAIDSFLAAHLKANGQPGLSVAIVKDGKVVLAKGYGQCSLEERLPVDKDTLFAIGSVTKQFTCACVLLLAEEGKLSVHDKVAKYYPSLTRADDITLLDLMNHVSGYPDYYPLDFVDRRMRQVIALTSCFASTRAGNWISNPAAAIPTATRGSSCWGVWWRRSAENHSNRS